MKKHKFHSPEGHPVIRTKIAHNKYAYVDTITNQVILYNGFLSNVVKYGSKFIPLPGASLIGDIASGFLEDQEGKKKEVSPLGTPLPQRHHATKITEALEIENALRRKEK